MKPEKPITRKEMYLDVATGGSTELPSPVTREEKYLAKIAGMAVDLPTPVPLKHKFLAKIAGMQIDVPTYTTGLPRIYAYLAKAAGQDVEIPQPVTREEMYWFDYCGGTPTPPEREYTGAVPVTFIADGTPLLDYIISGNTAQSGTPTPDNPIMPEGTGERTGNLFDKDAIDTNNGYMNSKYIGYDGNIGNSANHNISEYIAIPVGAEHLTISNVSQSTYVYCQFYDSSKNAISIFRYDTIPRTVSIPSNAKYIRCSISKVQMPNFMLNTGSTALPYEPYGIKIPISSANTTTPVYLGVETTRKIKKLVLTGNEIILRDKEREGSWRFFTDKYISAKDSTGICSHFENIGTNGVNNSDNIGFSIFNNAQFGCRCPKSIADTVTDFKAYLAAQYAAGTPVTVWYVLATPETAVVNEPLMKIGDYADTLSMEQAGVSIPTANGSTTLDVETTVKPSEVYIKYKGV